MVLLPPDSAAEAMSASQNTRRDGGGITNNGKGWHWCSPYVTCVWPNRLRYRSASITDVRSAIAGPAPAF